MLDLKQHIPDLIILFHIMTLLLDIEPSGFQDVDNCNCDYLGVSDF
jgi:hypothetical protein